MNSRSTSGVYCMLQAWHWCHSSIDNMPVLYFWGHGFKCWHGDFILWLFFFCGFLESKTYCRMVPWLVPSTS